jgi:mevalonate kinase
LGAFLVQQEARAPILFSTHLKATRNQVYEMKKGLEAGDLEKVGTIMTENHEILIDIGLSHETLVYLCNLALEKGSLVAKVTGGGRGGYMVALTPGRELQNAVASAIEKEGYKVIRTTVGGR